MLELDDQGLVTALHIFYDTVTTRPAFERETGGSWRATDWPHRIDWAPGPRPVN
jgi:hypothetical protein